MLTQPQRLALRALFDQKYMTPQEIGYSLASPTSARPLKPQGAGRLGGSMAHRLIRKGFVEDASFLHYGFPAYRITGAGRLALRPAPAPSGTQEK